MQGRQRVVRHPVGDSPLESASIGRHSMYNVPLATTRREWKNDVPLATPQ